jgi:cytochrome oxidase Cu insertion factor (SCO1/SenC/PrrC family)
MRQARGSCSLDVANAAPRSIRRMIEPDQPAPDFELPNQDGDPVRLSDLRGKRVVLYFYPKAERIGQ